MAQDPAFLLYYKDILVSCADMDADVLGWYTRLLCHQADKPDGLPNDPESLALLAGVKMSQYERFTSCWKHTLAAKFEANEQGLLQNPAQAGVIEARRDYKNKQSKRGIVGAFIKKIKGAHGFDNEQFKELSHLLVKSIINENEHEKIESILKHTLEAYATSIYAIANAIVDISIKEDSSLGKGKEGEKEKEPPKPKTVYQRTMALYYNFFKARNEDEPPKIDKKHGEALKSILSHLAKSVNSKQAGLSPPDSDEKIVESFKRILDDWDLLGDFNKAQMDLTRMNSQFNQIISEIKNAHKNAGNNGTKTTQRTSGQPLSTGRGFSYDKP